MQIEGDWGFRLRNAPRRGLARIRRTSGFFMSAVVNFSSTLNEPAGVVSLASQGWGWSNPWSLILVVITTLLECGERIKNKPWYSSALLQHEKSNDIALNCATTKRHTVVCHLVMERAIAYLRVSTQQQQRSGLGIEAQRATVRQFAAAERLTIVAEFVEFESGKGADALDRRPQLAAALAAAKASKCSVVVAKRTSRPISRAGKRANLNSGSASRLLNS